MERIAPGSFGKTFVENRNSMRVLLQHGMDFQAGDNAIATIGDLGEDKVGARYGTPMIDTPYIRNEIVPRLRAGVYGASFRFQVIKEEWVEEPKPSDYNPRGMPERTLKEVRVPEFGPVTFPAYVDATAGVRSLTDLYVRSRLGIDLPEPPRSWAVGSFRSDSDPDPEQPDEPAALPEPEPEPSSTPEPESRTEAEPVAAPPTPVVVPAKPKPRRFRSDDEWLRALQEMNSR
jgi:HK97 family phage prohead protease